MTPDHTLVDAVVAWLVAPATITDDHLAALASVDPGWKDHALERRGAAKAVPATTAGNQKAIAAFLAGLFVTTATDRNEARILSASVNALRERVLELEADKAARAEVTP